MSIISIIFVIVGILFILIDIFFLANISLPSIVLGVFVIGISQIYLGLAMNRLANLEEKLSRFIYDFDSDDLPMMRCDKCGRKYDMDVDECPYCEVKRLNIFHTNKNI